MDAQGNLYGTTYYSGAYGNGTVFKVDTTGRETVLYSFANNPDGANPYAGVVLDAKGNLYGTTFRGGAYSDWGTVFKVDATGSETVLHSFADGLDGGHPYAGVVLDSQGSLYGTTYMGGASIYGTVFALLKSAAATTTTLTSAPNPSTYAEAVTFTAVVSGGAGAPPDGETVTFMNLKTVLGTGTLSGGSASFTTSTLPVGTHPVKAVYAGDIHCFGSTSNAVKQVVKKVKN